MKGSEQEESFQLISNQSRGVFGDGSLPSSSDGQSSTVACILLGGGLLGPPLALGVSFNKLFSGGGSVHSLIFNSYFLINLQNYQISSWLFLYIFSLDDPTLPIRHLLCPIPLTASAPAARLLAS